MVLSLLRRRSLRRGLDRTRAVLLRVPLRLQSSNLLSKSVELLWSLRERRESQRERSPRPSAKD